jgi:hypothetical protein
MRGSDARTGELFSYVDLEDRVPAKHPLRVIRRIVTALCHDCEVVQRFLSFVPSGTATHRNSPYVTSPRHTS